MENASKALIIAGAVLVAIVIISMGVYLISSNQKTVEIGAETADTVAINTFNATFEKYSGKIKGSTLKQLYIDVKTSNSKLEDSRKITINGKQTTQDLSTAQSNINPYTEYKVSIDYYDNGYVSTITVDPDPT